MTLDLLASAVAISGESDRLNPIKLFLDADIVVQAIMFGLLLASIWVWMIIITFTMRMGGIQRRCDEYEDGFWEAENFETFQKDRARRNVPLGKVAGAGLAEWRRNAQARNVDHEGARQRIALAMTSSLGEEADALSDRLNFLATVGSVAPFVGLFGTVWGIMNSFFQIGQQQNSSLAVVAPGISEALFATAIGLFAAIPAVIAYNRFSHRVNSFEARMQRFADQLHAALTRQLEQR
ncbi:MULTISPECIES: protein TolQ [Novosphingobium]|uniref:Cell division and transport-associated protein TolQ n=1 Tax=Novosphingobium mathurense TaxID=428990 RepID=A0A1U6ICT3_9SPHN|nr:MULTISPECIES: protein TolQ [Novosphingobium]CDO35768.1 TolQ protein [Novosphingobium sp. KN65.2]SLK05809.1 Cell division and transport-associated protein TolQ [Novosphingobium mathurense]